MKLTFRKGRAEKMSPSASERRRAAARAAPALAHMENGVIFDYEFECGSPPGPKSFAEINFRAFYQNVNK